MPYVDPVASMYDFKPVVDTAAIRCVVHTTALYFNPLQLLSPDEISHAARCDVFSPEHRKRTKVRQSFHSRLRDEFLSMEELDCLRTAQRLSTVWRDDYNQNRPHTSLDYQTPAEFAASCTASDSTTTKRQTYSKLA
ncbi:MAG TPA: hypothetical protein DDW52_24800 [Planctomycetaceae bacterium]|nr:hypothetical protein [Planctomycetaceae bacterium]